MTQKEKLEIPLREPNSVQCPHHLRYITINTINISPGEQTSNSLACGKYNLLMKWRKRVEASAHSKVMYNCPHTLLLKCNFTYCG